MSRRGQAGAGAEHLCARLTPEERAAWAAYRDLPRAERERVIRLMSISGAPLALAVAAVRATKGADR